MTTAPFPIDPVLTGITLAYRNRRLIADDVLPRTLPLPRQEFKYKLWNKDERFTIPSTLVGRRSQPHEVEFSASEETASTKDYGLDDLIPNDDVANAGNMDIIGNATESLTDLILLDREKRVADLVFDADTYPVANSDTLSGTDQWSDFDDSDPIGDIQGALDVPLFRPNIMVIGRLAFSKLTMHPAIIKAVNRTSGDTGIARRQDIAEMFELEEVLVGEAFLNSSKPGQTASYSRVWGKHCALLYRDRLATNPNGNRITFGFTAEFGNRVSGQIPEPKVGLRGATRVRVGESVVEKVVASDVGFLLENVVA